MQLLYAFGTLLGRVVGPAGIVLAGVLLVMQASAPAQASPRPQAQARYEFDAQVFTDSVGYKLFRDCSNGTSIDFAQSQYASHFRPGRYYHVSGTGPSAYPNRLWQIDSSREILGCPGARLSPPSQVSFYADQNQVTVGQCTTLHWDIEGVRGVYLDGQGVTGHETRNVCPRSSTAYTLRAAADSGDLDRTVMVYVLPPQPSEKPVGSISPTVPVPVLTPTFTFEFVALRWDPPTPHWGDDVVFYAQFNNTLAEQRYLSWRVEICTPDCPNWTKLMFQTDQKQEYVAPGGMSEVVSRPWPLRGKGGTQTYPVRLVHVAADGTRSGEQVYYVTVTP